MSVDEMVGKLAGAEMIDEHGVKPGTALDDILHAESEAVAEMRLFKFARVALDVDNDTASEVCALLEPARRLRRRHTARRRRLVTNP